MHFINREKELNAMEEKWIFGKSQFLILYGKRRVGKTELIKHFIKNKPAIYFLADKRTHKEQLLELSKVISSFFHDDYPDSHPFQNWLEVFQYLKNKGKKPYILAIDEYPYLVETEKAVSSLFQKGWDEYLKNTGAYLILTGSSIAMMESETLGYKSPLYGRRTGQMLIEPLTFGSSWKFFPKLSFEKFLEIYSITGGMPAYLQQFDGSKSIEKNILGRVFPKIEFLHNEVDFLLNQELREPRNYFAIIRAIALGKGKFGEIANETGLGKNILHKYFDVLQKLRILEKETPVIEKNPQKSRKFLYKISDQFTGFWFKYIYPFKGDLEIERSGPALANIKQHFHEFVGASYEKVCQELLLNFSDSFFPFEKIGRYWDSDREIDLMAIYSSKKAVLFGEVKWSSKPVGTNIYEDLKRKSIAVEWNNSVRREYFALFSKSGFTTDMIRLAKQKGVLLVHGEKRVA